MKIRLPLALCAALLACISLPRLTAADFTAVAGTPIKVTASGSTDPLGLTDESVNQAGNTVLFNGVASGYWDAGTNNAQTYNFNLNLTGNGLHLNDGFSNTVYTFAGDVTGSGNFVFDKAAVSQKYVFTGDLSAYEGSFLITASNTSYIHFGSGQTVDAPAAEHIAGTGAVTGTGNRLNVEFNYGNDVTATNNFTNTTIKNAGAGSLTLSGVLTNVILDVTSGISLSGTGNTQLGVLSSTGTYTLGNEFGDTLANLQAKGGNIIIDADLTVTSGVTANSGNSITVNAGKKLTLSGKTDIIDYNASFNLVVKGELALGDRMTVKGGATVLTLEGGSLTGGGALHVNTGSAAFTVNSSGNSSIESTLYISTQDLALNVTDGTLLLQGNIANQSGASSRAVVKNGEGVLTVAGSANNYTGGTTINAGTLKLDKDSSLGTGTVTMNGGKLTSNSTGRATVSNAVTVAQNASASITGITLSGTTTVSTGATLTLADVCLAGATSTLNCNGNLTLNYGSLGVITAAESGQTNFTCNAAAFFNGGTLSVTETGSLTLSVSLTQMYALQYFGYDSLTLHITDGTTTINATDLTFELAETMLNRGLTFDTTNLATNGTVTISGIQASQNIPEPASATLALAGIGALLFRRRKA